MKLKFIIIFIVFLLSFNNGILRANNNICIDPYNSVCEINNTTVVPDPTSGMVTANWEGVRNSFDSLSIQEAILNLDNSNITINNGGFFSLGGKDGGTINTTTFFNMSNNSTFNMNINNNPESKVFIMDLVKIDITNSNFFVGDITDIGAKDILGADYDRISILDFRQEDSFSVINQIDLSGNNASYIQRIQIQGTEDSIYSMTINGLSYTRSDGTEGLLAIRAKDIGVSNSTGTGSDGIILIGGILNINGDVLLTDGISKIDLTIGSSFNFEGDILDYVKAINIDDSTFIAKEGSNIDMQGNINITTNGLLDIGQLTLKNNSFSLNLSHSEAHIDKIVIDNGSTTSMSFITIASTLSDISIGELDLTGSSWNSAGRLNLSGINNTSNINIGNIYINAEGSNLGLLFSNFYGNINNIYYDGVSDIQIKGDNRGEVNIVNTEVVVKDTNSLNYQLKILKDANLGDLSIKSHNYKETEVDNNGVISINVDQGDNVLLDFVIQDIGDGSINYNDITCLSNCSEININNGVSSGSSSIFINNFLNKGAVENNINTFSDINLNIIESFTSGGTLVFNNSSITANSFNGEFSSLDLTNTDMIINGESAFSGITGKNPGETITTLAINVDNSSKFIVNAENIFVDSAGDQANPDINNYGIVEFNENNIVRDFYNYQGASATLKGSTSERNNVRETFTNEQGATLNIYEGVIIHNLDNSGILNVYGLLSRTIDVNALSASEFNFKTGSELILYISDDIEVYGRIEADKISFENTAINVEIAHTSILKSGESNYFELLKTNPSRDRDDAYIKGIDYDNLSGSATSLGGTLDIMPDWLYYSYGKSNNNGSGNTITCDRGQNCSVYGDLTGDNQSNIKVISSGNAGSNVFDSITFLDSGLESNTLNVSGESWTLIKDSRDIVIGIDTNGDGNINDIDITGDGNIDTIEDIISSLGSIYDGETFWLNIQRLSSFEQLVNVVPNSGEDKAIIDLAKIIDKMVADSNLTSSIQDIVNSLDFNSGCVSGEEDIYDMHNNPNYVFNVEDTPCLYNIVENIKSLKPIDNEVFLVSSINISNAILGNLLNKNRQYYRLGETYSWTDVDINFGNLASENFVEGYNSFYTNFQTGITYSPFQGVNISGAFGVTAGSLSGENNTYDSSIFGISLGFSASYIHWAYYLSSAFSINSISYDNKRYISFLNNTYVENNNDMASSFNEMIDMSLALELGTEISLGIETYLVPKVFINNHIVSNNGFEEEGAAGAMTYKPMQTNVLEIGIGTNIYKELLLPEVLGIYDAFWYPSIELNIISRTYNAPSTEATFNKYSDNYLLTVEPADYSGILMNFKGRIEYDRSKTNIILSYNLDIANDYINNSISALFKYKLN